MTEYPDKRPNLTEVQHVIPMDIANDPISGQIPSLRGKTDRGNPPMERNFEK